MPKNTINYRAKVKELRKFVDFDFSVDLRKTDLELTPSQKRQITIYHKEYKLLTARPNQLYRARNKKNKLAAQKYSQQNPSLKKFKGVFVPVSGTGKAKLKFDSKNKLTVIDDFVSTTALEFNKKKLLDNPKKEAKKVIKESGGDSFTIRVGKFEMPKGYSATTLPNKILELATNSKYNVEGSAHYFGDWLVGVNSHTFKNQSTFNEYLNEKQKNKKELQLDRKNAKRRDTAKRNKQNASNSGSR
tara:strand:+ start:6734 stop:7468 length:735 start_codon:yes stop_codon:yes gene_type:complete